MSYNSHLEGPEQLWLLDGIRVAVILAGEEFALLFLLVESEIANVVGELVKLVVQIVKLFVSRISIIIKLGRLLQLLTILSVILARLDGQCARVRFRRLVAVAIYRRAVRVIVAVVRFGTLKLLIIVAVVAAAAAAEAVVVGVSITSVRTVGSGIARLQKRLVANTHKKKQQLTTRTANVDILCSASGPREFDFLFFFCSTPVFRAQRHDRSDLLFAFYFGREILMTL